MKQNYKDKGCALLLLVLMMVLFVTGCTFTIGTYKNKIEYEYECHSEDCHPMNENIDYAIPPAIYSQLRMELGAGE